jgi:hypothetical protein
MRLTADLLMGSISSYGKEPTLITLDATSYVACIFLAESQKVKSSVIKSRDYIVDFFEQHHLIEAIREHKRRAAPLRKH